MPEGPWVAALAAAAGCGRCPPLADAPILPADVPHARIRAGLVAADAEFVPETCVDHVRVGELGGGHYGKYALLGRSVRLAPYLSGEWLDEVLRHELCHAVDRQNDLVRGREDLFTDAWSIDWTDGGERREAAEGFAHVCELGRDALAALWQPTCPGDPDLRAARVVRDEVYGVGADPAAGAWLEPIAEAPWPPDAGSPAVMLSTSGVLAAVGLGVTLYLDPWTGEEVDPGEPFDPADRPVPPDPPPGWSAASEETVGGPIDGATAVVVGELRSVLRWQVHTEQGWAPADAPYPNGSTRFFSLDGELWSIQVDGSALAWGRWRAR